MNIKLSYNEAILQDESPSLDLELKVHNESVQLTLEEIFDYFCGLLGPVNAITLAGLTYAQACKWRIEDEGEFPGSEHQLRFLYRVIRPLETVLGGTTLASSVKGRKMQCPGLPLAFSPPSGE